MKLTKEVITSANAPAAIGPYSPGVSASGKLTFISGQLPIDPATGAFPEGGIQAQTRQSLTNLRALLNAAGADMENIMKTTVFLKDMNDFAAMNGVYNTFFAEGNYPARSAVEVAALPKNAKVEIEAVAHI